MSSVATSNAAKEAGPIKFHATPIELTPSGRWAEVDACGGGRITSDAGALVLREMAATSKLFERMPACVTDPRDPDVKDRRGLRVDPMVQGASGR